VKLIAWPMLAARTKVALSLRPIKGIERYASRQFSRPKSPVKVLNHRLAGMSSEIAVKAVDGINTYGMVDLAEVFFARGESNS
jgi:hypothetical protein